MTADATLRIRGDTTDASGKVRDLDAQTNSLGQTFGRAGGGAERFGGSIKSGQERVEKLATAVTGASSVLGGMGSQAGATAGAVSNLLAAAISGPLVAGLAVATTAGAYVVNQWGEAEKKAKDLDDSIEAVAATLEQRLGRELKASRIKVQEFRDEFVDLQFDLTFGGGMGPLQQVNAAFTKVQKDQLKAEAEVNKARQRVRDEEERLEQARADRRSARNEGEVLEASNRIKRSKEILDAGGESGGLRQRLRTAEREAEVLNERERIIVEEQAPAAQAAFDAQEEIRKLAEAERKREEAERKAEREAERAAERARRDRIKATKAEAASEAKNAEIRDALQQARIERARERASSTQAGAPSEVQIGSTIWSDLAFQRELEGRKQVSQQEFELRLGASEEAKRLETEKVNFIISEIQREERFKLAIGEDASAANVDRLMAELATHESVEEAKTFILKRELDKRQQEMQGWSNLTNRMAQESIGFMTSVANTAFTETLDVIEQVSAGQQVEFQKIAAAFVRNIGTQMVGIGLRFAAEGAGWVASALIPGQQGNLPGGLALIGTGAAIAGLGASMAVGGAVAQGQMSRFSGSSSGGGGATSGSLSQVREPAGARPEPGRGPTSITIINTAPVYDLNRAARHFSHVEDRRAELLEEATA